ncbi:U3 snoRNP protein, partial [Gryganskiella cystojenkinii]
PPFKDQLFGFIEASKIDKKWRIAAANAITILIRAGVHLSRLDLRRIQVPGADMSFGVFDSAPLQGADLRKTNLQSVWFRQADLRRARMEGSRFGESPILSDMNLSYAFAYTLDGEVLVAGANDGKIILYNASTWAILATIQGHDQRVTNIAISRDSSLLATGADTDGIAQGAMAAKIWDLKTGNFLHALKGHTNRFTGLIFLPSGQRIVTGSYDRAIHLWEVKSGVRLHSFEVQPDHAVVDAIACSGDGELLASSYEDRTVRLWDIETSECLRVLTGHRDSCHGITFSPSGKTLAITSHEGIKTWDVASGEKLWTLEKSMTTHGPAVYSPDGLQIACGSEDNALLLLDSATGEISRILRGHTGRISSVEFSPDGSQLASGSNDRTVRLWDSKTGASGPVFQGHTEPVLSVHFSTSGRQIGSSSWDGTVRLWDSRGSTLNPRPRESHKYSVTTYIVPGGRYIASQCVARIGIWDRESGNLMHRVDPEEHNYHDIVVSPCGLQVASVGYNGVVKLWNLDTGQCVLTIDQDSDVGWDWSVTFSLDGTRLLTTGKTAAKVWNRRTGVLERELMGHDHPVEMAIFSPVGGRQLATFSGDLTVRLWDMSTGQCTATFVTPDTATGAAYSSDGSRIATHCRRTTTIHSWDTSTGKGLPVIDTGCQNHLLFSADGRFLTCYSGTPWEEGVQEGTLQVWDMIKGRRVWTLGKTMGYAVAAMSHDSQFLISSSRGEEGAIRLWDLKTGQQIGKMDHYRGTHGSLALDMHIAGGGGNSRGGGNEELIMTVGSYEGDVSVWKLVAHEGPILKDGIVERTLEGSAITSNHSDSKKIDEWAGDKRYEFALQWTTAYGRLNAAGAKIEGVRGLSRVNARLLKQHGADGEVVAPLKLHQVATKMMSPKNFLARFKKQPSTPSAEITALAEKDGAVSVVSLTDKECEKVTARDLEE